MRTQTVTGIVPEFQLHDRLRKAREITGLTQVEFAEKIGLAAATVGNAESGRKKPHRNNIKLWALATGVSYEWLLSGETPAPSDDGTGVEYRAPSQIRTDDLFFKRPELRQAYMLTA